MSAIVENALAAGAVALKAPAKSLWGFGGTLQAPDGTIWKFATPASPIGLGLYKRAALAKDAGVPADGTGSHRLAIGSGSTAFTDPDGFAWEGAQDR